MFIYPEFNKIAFHIGAVSVYWYGIMYLLSFVVAYFLGKRRERIILNRPHSGDFLGDFIFYAALGVVFGGRIGYTIIYNYQMFFQDPLVLFRVWEGGMSFHGGLLGVIIALILFARKYKLSFWSITDFAAPLVPTGLFFGRIGNFINGELWGRVTNVPWAMIYPIDHLPRHPSEIYEALGEGVLLFLILWFYSRKKRTPGKISAMFLIFYGIIRFVLEFFREPDVQMGFVAFGWMTMGQALSGLMVLFGIALYFYKARLPREKRENP